MASSWNTGTPDVTPTVTKTKTKTPTTTRSSWNTGTTSPLPESPAAIEGAKEAQQSIAGKEVGPWHAGASSFLNTALLNHLPQIEATFAPGDQTYENALAQNKAFLAGETEAHPTASTLGNVAGYINPIGAESDVASGLTRVGAKILPRIATALSKTGGAALLSRMGANAALGSGVAIGSNAVRNQGDGLSPTENIGNAAAFGGALGAITPLMTAAMKAAARHLTATGASSSVKEAEDMFGAAPRAATATTPAYEGSPTGMIDIPRKIIDLPGITAEDKLIQLRKSLNYNAAKSDDILGEVGYQHLFDQNPDIDPDNLDDPNTDILRHSKVANVNDRLNEAFQNIKEKYQQNIGIDPKAQVRLGAIQRIQNNIQTPEAAANILQNPLQHLNDLRQYVGEAGSFAPGAKPTPTQDAYNALYGELRGIIDNSIADITEDPATANELQDLNHDTHDKLILQKVLKRSVNRTTPLGIELSTNMIPGVATGSTIQKIALPIVKSISPIGKGPLGDWAQAKLGKWLRNVDQDALPTPPTPPSGSEPGPVDPIEPDALGSHTLGSIEPNTLAQPTDIPKTLGSNILTGRDVPSEGLPDGLSTREVNH